MSWAVILCQLSDVPQETEPKVFFDNFFTSAGRGTKGLFDYWDDVSYGTFINNSQVFGWFTIPHTAAELAATPRTVYQQWGFDAATAAGIDLGQFPRRIFFFNGNADHGATWNGTTTFAYAPGRPLEPTFMMHEMGHTLGLNHSFSDSSGGCCGSNTPGEYCDPWDIMSAMCVFQFADANGQSGPGLNVPNLFQLGWLAEGRVSTGSGSIQLTPINRADLPGYLAARCDYRDSQTHQMCTYVVEYRAPTSWDEGLPYPAVLIPEFYSSH